MLSKAFEGIGIQLPKELQGVGKAVLKRAVIGVSGPEAVKFLNGLTTSKVVDMEADDSPVRGQYTAFLNPQGRMLYDGFLFKRDKNNFLVDCDDRVGIDLFYHLEQHKLRAKVKLLDLSKEYRVETWWNLPSLLNGPKLTITDPRGSLGLLRSLTPRTEPKNTIPVEENVKYYDLLRFAAGIAEGPLELKRVQSIPLEFNLDWLGAVAFDKGCYIGQELMARTHFRGTIRKRLLPFKILTGSTQTTSFMANADDAVEGIPSGAELFAVSPPDAKSMQEVQQMEMDAQPVGKVIGSMGNLGMAVIRLANWTPGHRFAIHRPTPGASDQRQFVLVEPYKPHWWPSLDQNEVF